MCVTTVWKLWLPNQHFEKKEKPGQTIMKWYKSKSGWCGTWWSESPSKNELTGLLTYSLTLGAEKTTNFFVHRHHACYCYQRMNIERSNPFFNSFCAHTKPHHTTMPDHSHKKCHNAWIFFILNLIFSPCGGWWRYGSLRTRNFCCFDLVFISPTILFSWHDMTWY